jgi:hypothetical protein
VGSGGTLGFAASVACGPPVDCGVVLIAGVRWGVPLGSGNPPGMPVR